MQLGLVSRGSSGRECSCQWRSGLGRARRHLCRFLVQYQHGTKWQTAWGYILVNASSLSPMKMAESYWCLFSASWRQSFKNFSIFCYKHSSRKSWSHKSWRMGSARRLKSEQAVLAQGSPMLMSRVKSRFELDLGDARLRIQGLCFGA